MIENCQFLTFKVNFLEGGASNLRLINGCFTTISSQIFAIYIHIFHKTEVQTVILRCLTGLYLIWFKSYATNTKNKTNKQSAKSMKNIIQMSAFLQNRKNPETEIFVFCVITFDPITI